MPFKDRVVCVGTFDGVHIGHQRLIRAAKAIAEANQMSLCAITFSNHPLEVLSPNDAPKLLSTMEEKLQLLSKLGVEECLLVEFDRLLAQMGALEFCDMLIGELRARVLVMGENSSIGCACEGTARKLSELSEDGKLKMRVVIVEPVKFGSLVVSSSWVRSELMRGHVRLAQRMLGRAYSLGGVVISGKTLGRQIGFPTLNLRFDQRKLLPRFGVYVGIAEIAGCRLSHYMVSNIGIRPTVGGGDVSVEAHIIDEEVEIRYGDSVTLRFLFFIRPERRFDDLSQLANQIARDVERAKRLLHSVRV